MDLGLRQSSKRLSTPQQGMLSNREQVSTPQSGRNQTPLPPLDKPCDMLEKSDGSALGVVRRKKASRKGLVKAASVPTHFDHLDQVVRNSSGGISDHHFFGSKNTARRMQRPARLDQLEAASLLLGKLPPTPGTPTFRPTSAGSARAYSGGGDCTGAEAHGMPSALSEADPEDPDSPTTIWRRKTLTRLNSKTSLATQSTAVVSPVGTGASPSEDSPHPSTSTSSRSASKVFLGQRSPSKGGATPKPLAAKPKSRGPTFVEAAADRVAGWLNVESDIEASPPKAKTPEPATDEADVQEQEQTQMDEAVALQKLLPDMQRDLQLVASRVRAEQGDESELGAQMERVRRAYDRFQISGCKEVDKTSLPQILQQVGYPTASEAQIAEVVEQVTKYATLGMDELVEVVTRFAKIEKEKLTVTFDKFDADNSGGLDLEETLELVKEMGFLMLRSTVKEVVDLLDIDSNGVLDCEEMTLLLHYCRHTRGFAREEVMQLAQIFLRQHAAPKPTKADTPPTHESDLCVPIEQLGVLLKAFFGTTAAGRSQLLAEEAAQLRGTFVTFPELLAWAEKLRQQLFQDYRIIFEQVDPYGNGTITMQEMQNALSLLGYTLSVTAINERVASMQREGKWPNLPWDPSAMSLDFLISIMCRLSQTDGFMVTEHEEIKATFDRFASKGVIDAIELNDMLQDLGYQTKCDEVTLLMGQVTTNTTHEIGKLDFREFLRFMRLHRESELAQVKEVFQQYTRQQSHLDESTVQLAVAELMFEGHDQEDGLGDEAQAQDLVAKADYPMNFDAFVVLTDQIRLNISSELRKHAGYTEAEVGSFRKLFNQRDSTKLGTLSFVQVSELLLDLNMPMQDETERKDVVRLLARARATCEHHGSAVKGETNFWCVVQLLRFLHRRNDKRRMEKLRAAAAECNYTVKEVAGFQEVFMDWWGRSEESQQDSNDKALCKVSVEKLLVARGATLEMQDKEALGRKLYEISEHGLVDCPDFMRLMRWMTDTDFAGLSKLKAQNVDEN